MGKRKHRRATLIDLAPVIEQVIQEYGEAVYDVLPDAVEEVTEDATDKLKAGKWSDYSASWTNSDVVFNRIHTKKVIHNEEHYRLTHLLEKGHVIRNGTQRTFGRTSAQPHIKPVEKWAQDELPKLVERKLNNL